MSSILPILSICIPTFNRKNGIISLLQSIDNNKDIEVVIIDDGSTDDLKKAINYKQFDLNIGSSLYILSKLFNSFQKIYYNIICFFRSFKVD